MTNAKDNIRVGRIIMVFSEQKQGWIAPGGRVIRNPLKAQRLAEELNSKRVAA